MSLVADPPGHERGLRQIDDEGLVVRAAKLEPVELPGRILRNRPSDQGEPARPRPAMGLAPEPRRRDLARAQRLRDASRSVRITGDCFLCCSYRASSDRAQTLAPRLCL